MKFIAIIGFLLSVSGNLTFFYTPSDNGDTSVLKSIQGTWIYAEPGAEIWMKAVIKGKILTGYAASPGAGRFTATSKHKLREVRLIYGNRRDRTFRIESFAEIRNPYLTGDRIVISTDGTQEFIGFEKSSPVKFRKVPPDFDPWIQK
jgi:hypothetical protein